MAAQGRGAVENGVAPAVRDKLAERAATAIAAPEPCRCDQQAEAEDRAAMGVDAAGRAQHRPLGLDPDHAEPVHLGACRAGGGEIGEERTEHIGAVAKQRCVHIGVRARIDRTDEPGLGIGIDLLMERTDCARANFGCRNPSAGQPR